MVHNTQCFKHFFVPEFSSSKVFSHEFHVNGDEVKYVNFYEMIIGRDPMVQLGLKDGLITIFEWYRYMVPMKEKYHWSDHTNLTKSDMKKVV